MINLRFAGGTESWCMHAFTARHNVLGCVLLDTASNNTASHWPVCRSAVNTPDTLSPSLSFVWRLRTSCWSQTDRMSDFQLSLCCAVLAEFLLSFSPSDVVCLLFVLWHPPSLFAAALRELKTVPARICVFVCLPVSQSVLTSVVHLQPAELWRCGLCQRLPESFFLSTLTPPPLH